MSLAKGLFCQFKDCGKLFKEPVLLPCGNSICREHLRIDVLSDFVCFFCNENHEVNEKNLPLNQDLIKTIESRLSNEQIQAKELIEDINAINNELVSLAEKPKNFLKNYFLNLKQEISNQKLKSIQRVESFFDNFLQETEKFENDCIEQVEQMTTNDLKLITQERFEELREEFRRVALNDNELAEYLCNAKQLFKLTKFQFESFKNELLSGRNFSFESFTDSLKPEMFGKIIYEAGILHNFENHTTDKLGKNLKTYTGHTDRIVDIKLFERKNRIISASVDKTIKIWDLESGECLTTLEQESSLSSLCILPSFKFVSGTDQGHIKVWSLFNPSECLRSLKEQNRVDSLCFLSNNRLACAIRDNSVVIRDATDLKLIKLIKINTILIVTHLSCKSNFMIIESMGCVEIWDIDNLECIRVLNDTQMERLECLAISLFDNKNYLYTFSSLNDGNEHGLIKVWNIESGECVEKLGEKLYLKSTFTSCQIGFPIHFQFISTNLLAIQKMEDNLKDERLVYDIRKKEMFTELDLEFNTRFEFMSNGNFLTAGYKDIKLWHI